jgi:hypothetical protein
MRTLFGDQYVQEVRDSLGEHSVLRYRPTAPRGAEDLANLAAERWISTLFVRAEPCSCLPHFQEVG